MTLFLALLSSTLLGAADFAGGLAVRRAHAATVVLWSHAIGLCAAIVLVTTVLPGRPGGADLGWGGLAGLTGAAGAVLLYRALGRGLMLAAAPVAAVTAAAVPIAAGVLAGEHLGGKAWAGVAVAVVALVLVSRSGPTSLGVPRVDLGRTLAYAAGAGVSFGLFMVCLAHTSAASSLWPLVSARTVSLALLLAVVLRSGRRGSALRLAPGALRLAVLAGLLDVLSSACYLLAVRDGSLAVVGLLASLSPVTTVLLAGWLLRERTAAHQRVGAVLALGSLVMLAS